MRGPSLVCKTLNSSVEVMRKDLMTKTNNNDAENEPTSQNELTNLFTAVGERLTDEFYLMACDFLSCAGLPEFEGNIPLEIWTGIAQAIADNSGYTVILRSELLEPAEDSDKCVSVGQQDEFCASPMLFVVPGKKNRT